MDEIKDTPTCLHTMYAENQTKWLSEYLQAELTIVSTSQTKHLIPCFQYEFDIQQYSTTPGGQCWGSDPQCRGRWKDWYYHDVGYETQDLKTKKAQISMIFCIMSVIIFLDRDFLRPASPLFSPLPSTKPVLFIPGPGSQNQMFGLASVHNG